MMATVTPGTTPPVSSTTVPLREAVEPCAKATRGTARANAAPKTTLNSGRHTDGRVRRNITMSLLWRLLRRGPLSERDEFGESVPELFCLNERRGGWRHRC